MLATAVRNTNKLIREKSASEGIRIGNRFPKKDTARRMATLFLPDSTEESVLLLDPAAGTGILTAAAVEQLVASGAKEIHADLYETDPDYLPVLDKNMRRVRRLCHRNGVRFRFTLKSESFLLSYAPDKTDLPLYHYAVLHIYDALMEKEDPASLAYESYFSVPVSVAFYYLAATLRALRTGGQLVADLPTVFASSEALRRLREHLFDCYAVSHVHLFEKKDAVVETTGERRNAVGKHMLLHIVAAAPLENIQLSYSCDDGKEMICLPHLPRTFVVRGEERHLLLIPTEKELEFVRKMESLPETLASLGLSMRVGLTLPTRYPELLSDTPKAGYIPLLSPRSMRDGRIVFPLPGEKHQFLYPRIPSLQQKNKNMLLVKRVPAKADKRHLKAAVYLASQFPYSSYISTENKLITIDKDGGEMDARFLHGLYALLNSAVYECYFSILSKSAQVNISDYRDIPLPPADTIREIGKTLLTSRQFSARISDILVKNALRISTAE